MPIDYNTINGVPKQGELVAGHMSKFKHVPDNIRPKTTFADKPQQANFSEYLSEITKKRSGSSQLKQRVSHLKIGHSYMPNKRIIQA